MSWLTVVRMMQVKGGFRSPEDMRKTALNPEPNPQQLKPNDYVDRIRRIQLNDLESLLYFLVAGLLFVLTDPSVTLRTGCLIRRRARHEPTPAIVAFEPGGDAPLGANNPHLLAVDRRLVVKGEVGVPASDRIRG